MAMLTVLPDLYQPLRIYLLSIKVSKFLKYLIFVMMAYICRLIKISMVLFITYLHKDL